MYISVGCINFVLLPSWVHANLASQKHTSQQQLLFFTKTVDDKNPLVDVDEVLMNKDCWNTQGTVYNHFIRTIYTACPLKIKLDYPYKNKKVDVIFATIA